jgi:hypothetical protein
VENKTCFQALCGNLEGKKYCRSRGDNIKLDVQEIGYRD